LNTIGHVVAASARIAAAPERVFALLADYRQGRPRMLPAPIRDFTVERGGYGAGTIVRFRVRIAGRSQTLRAAVTEPDRGRVLAETNLEGRVAVTRFVVTPTVEGRASDVIVSTTLQLRSGIAGAVERFIATRVLGRMHRATLRRLDALVTSTSRAI
jgi:hypothetical protein